MAGYMYEISPHLTSFRDCFVASSIMFTCFPCFHFILYLFLLPLFEQGKSTGELSFLTFFMNFAGSMGKLTLSINFSLRIF